MKRLLIALAIIAFFCVGGHAQLQRPQVLPQRMPYSYYQFTGYLQADSGLLLPQRVANFTPKRSALIYDTGAARIKFYLNGWKSLQDVAFTRSYKDLVDTPTNVTTQGNTFNGALQLLQLDNAGKVYFANLPSTLMTYKGTWSAATNTPALADGTGVSGWMYQAIDSGVVDFGSGPITFFKNDYVGYNGSIWQWSPGNPGVRSVNGFQNIVNLTTVNIPEGGSVLYWTSARSRAAQSVTATGLTYDNSTGVISLTTGYTIPLTTDLANWNTAYSWGNWAAGTHYVGTTLIANNRASASQTLTGVSIDGNAATVTNGVYTTGSYADPAWIASLEYSKLTGAPSLSGYVPYTGAATTLDLGNQILRFNTGYNIYKSGADLVLSDNGGNFGFKSNFTTGAFTQLGTGTVTFNNTVNVGSGSGVVNVHHIAAAQATFFGYSDLLANRVGSGKIAIGAIASYQGVIQYYDGGQTALYIDNTYNDALAVINFRLRTAGTPVTALSLRGDGAATFSSTVTATGYNTTSSGTAYWTKRDARLMADDNTSLLDFTASTSGHRIQSNYYSSGSYYSITVSANPALFPNQFVLNTNGTVVTSILGSSGNVIVYADNNGTLGKMTIGSGLSFSGGVLTATGGSSGTITGSGTSGYVPLWNSASDIGNSVISQSGTVITVAGSIVATSFTAISMPAMGANTKYFTMYDAVAGGELKYATVTNVQSYLGLGPAAYLNANLTSFTNDAGFITNSTSSLVNYYTATNIQNFFSGASSITGYNYSNWNTAYSWGNHAGLYLPLTGGTLTGALNGTTAYFTGTVTAGSFFEIPSDIRKKEVVQRWTSADGMDAIAYYLKNDPAKKIMYGFEAQQVMTVLPTAVATHEDKTMPDGMTYSVGYTQVLVYKIAMLEKRIENLENEIKK